MQKIIIFFLVCVWMAYVPQLYSQAGVKFVTGGIPAAKSQALKEQKLYFAFFYTDWCLPCKWMDENTFQDKDLAEFISKNYVAVRINIDDFDGHNTRQQYGVEFLPTVLVFDQGGEVVIRFEESVSAKRIMEALRKERFDLENKSIRIGSGPPPSQRSPVTPPTTEVPQKKEEVKEVKQPEIVEQPVTKAKEPPKPKETVEDKPKSQPTKVKEQPKETVVLEEPTIEQPPAKPAPVPKTPPPAVSTEWTDANYYSVQVGTFSKFENADKMRNEYREIFGEGVHIKIEAVGADTIYKVMVGRYKSYDAAAPLLNLLREQGMDGFIKEVKQD